MATADDEFLELMRDKDRRRGHPDDDNDARSFLNLSESDHDDDTVSPPPADDEQAAPPPGSGIAQARSTIPRARYEANTGPKGVIADAQNFRETRRLHRLSVRGVASNGRPTPATSYGPNGSASLDEDGESLEAEAEGGERDDFMQRWRMGRMKELQSGGRDGAAHSQKQRPSVWGGLATVDGSGYLDAVDKSPAHTVVVVYIFDDHSEVSLAIEECLRELARKHGDVRFIRLNFEDAEMEPAGVPALLAYQRGDKFAGLIPVIDEMPDDADLDASTLETVLKRHGILR